MFFWAAILYYLFTHMGEFNWEISPDLTQYKQIGNRYFIFESDVELSWTDAKKACEEKRGHLATLKDIEELYRIMYEIKDVKFYWLGINDHENKGEFISLASGKRDPFLYWQENEPSYTENKKNCVYIFYVKMWVADCDIPRNFICQADREF